MLKEQGFRFVWQNGVFCWKHPSEIQHDAIDCTDMDADEFVAIVREKMSEK